MGSFSGQGGGAGGAPPRGPRLVVAIEVHEGAELGLRGAAPVLPLTVSGLPQALMTRSYEPRGQEVPAEGADVVEAGRFAGLLVGKHLFVPDFSLRKKKGLVLQTRTRTRAAVPVPSPSWDIIVPAQ